MSFCYDHIQIACPSLEHFIWSRKVLVKHNSVGILISKYLLIALNIQRKYNQSCQRHASWVNNLVYQTGISEISPKDYLKISIILFSLFQCKIDKSKLNQIKFIQKTYQQNIPQKGYSYFSIGSFDRPVIRETLTPFVPVNHFRKTYTVNFFSPGQIILIHFIIIIMMMIIIIIKFGF